MEEESNDTCTMSGEEVVISGMSGIFPNSESVQEFMDNLFNKVDMVSLNSNWNISNPELPKHIGKIKGLDKFDAQFFKVHYQQAAAQDPMTKKMMEHVYGAIFDSGNTPATLKGNKIGVFIGSYFTDMTSFYIDDTNHGIRMCLTGCSKALMANRISYWLDGTGPSLCLDNSCVSSTAALERAFSSIKSGYCDAAVVGGCNTCIDPSLSLNLQRGGLLCFDGKTKCFDKNGDGYVRSEAISLIFLQRAKDAKRVYAEVCYAQGGYQLKANDQFLPVRKTKVLQNFLNNVYSKIDVDPKDVEYVEANGAGLAEADTNEADAIASVFTRNNAVKLGSVKSNMGNSEAASGLCSLTKLCLAYYKGEIPANLHLQDPVQPVKDGKVQVLTENIKFDRGYTALNNFSLTGGSYHVILKGHYKKKNLEKYKCEIPRLVLASGRQESSVGEIFDSLQKKPVDAEEIALLHNIFEKDISGHTGRGYTILERINERPVEVLQKIDHYPGIKPPLWFVFSGMGSQWTGMGADLMSLPIFAAAIERCQKALQAYDVDVVKILTSRDKKIFDSVVNTFVGIGAIQIGLIDVLKEIGIVPDHIIGHSLGETACAYQDGTFTTEQMMLSIYCRSKVAEEKTTEKGLMVAVGLGYKDLVKYCPPEIDIACRNSSESSTISGPANIVEKFVGELTKHGIFTKIVPTGYMAYHSRYIALAGPILLTHLKAVITNPKPRSDKWISTSVQKEKWDDPAAKYSSAEYHVNNLLNPVYFSQATDLIPNKAVVVEIAPHGLLQAILKRSHRTCTHISLTNRASKIGGVKLLLEALGKLYTAGFNPKIDVLYPKVSFPVSTETPLLSHLVKWEHSETWPIVTNSKYKKVRVCASRKFVFSLQDDDYKYLNGYFINGVNVLPEAALITFVWETLAMYQGVDFQKLSVIFKNIQFHTKTIVNPETPVKLSVMISKGNNTFEVTQEQNLVMSGSVFPLNKVKLHNVIDHKEAIDEYKNYNILLGTQDIYKMLAMRGLDYREQFQSMLSANIQRTQALIKWTKRWTPFLDSLIQLNIISRDYNGVSKVKFIKELKISVQEHSQELPEIVNGVKCYFARLNGITRCAGVQIQDITYTDLPFKRDTADVIQTRTFLPFFPVKEVNMNTAFQMSLQIVSDNSNTNKILITKVVDNIKRKFDFVDDVVNISSVINIKIKVINVDSEEFSIISENQEDNTNVIFIENLLQHPKKIQYFQNISEDTFVLSLEDTIPKVQSPEEVFTIISCYSEGKRNLILMKKQYNCYRIDTRYISLKFVNTFAWIPDLYNELATSKRVVLISERQTYCGALGLVKTLKKNGHNNISIIMVEDADAPKFDPENIFYKKQLQKNIAINILQKGQWGSFYLKTSKLTINQKSFALKNFNPGYLKKVSWVEVPKISRDKMSAQVYFSGLSMKDYHKIMDDKTRENSLIGMDFSGIDSNGDKIMGLLAGGSTASTIQFDPDLIWPVPDHWTLEDAATVPLAYVQAFYCLTIRCNLQKGNTVLIYNGTSPVGLALINICLSLESTVFTVVDSEAKKKMLSRLNPQLDEKYIILSNDDDFYDTIMTNTKAQGCNYVINCANSTFRQAAAKCVGLLGTLLDISEHDIYENMDFGMSFLNFDRSFKIINITNIFKPEYINEKRILQKLITQGIKSGVVKPLSRVVFSPANVCQALKVLSINKHTGTILINVKDPGVMSNGLETIPRISYSPQDVIVMICDEKGIALELADKLIKRGARKIILHNISHSGYTHVKLLEWNKQDVSVKESSETLQTEKESVIFMKNAMKFGLVKGVFIVLDPKHTYNETKTDFINAFKKQSQVVVNLHLATRNCDSLSHFVVLCRDTKSVSNEYALSLTEKVCDSRNKIDLPALVVHYDAILELDSIELEANNTEAQTLSELFSAIETSLKMNHTNVFTFKLKEKIDNTVCNDLADNENAMSTFYKHLDTEEADVTSNAIVEVPTLSNPCNTTDWDPNESYIILVPGFEGRSQVFESMAERLKIRAVSVQLGPGSHEKSIKQIALNARQMMKKTLNVNNDGRFYILGYSFGVNVALELAAILEKEGRTGVVLCVDSSPDALQTTLKNVFGKFSAEQLQNHILNHMYNLIARKKGNELELTLNAFDTFEAKVEECLKKLNAVVTYSNQYKKLVLESAYNKIVMAREYRPLLKLRSQLVLIKNTKNLIASKLADDYSLSKYSNIPVKVYPLQTSDSATTLNDCRVSNIVHMFVDAKILDNFKKKNLCDVYLSNVGVGD